MKSRFEVLGSAAAAVLAGVVTAPSVSAHVFADDADPKYAVDIAAFATCDGHYEAKPELAAAAIAVRASAEQDL